MAGLETDPRCQPGAYIAYSNRLYMVLEITEGGMALCENCSTEYVVYLRPMDIKASELAKEAPAVPDEPPV